MDERMEFKDLPPEIQNIAAQTLKIRIMDAETKNMESLNTTAQMIRDAFIALYESEP